MARSIFGPAIDATTRTMTFLEERHRIIANNIANAGTPYYKARRAPLAEFQKALSRAVEAHKKSPGSPLDIRPTRHIRYGREGLRITPVTDGGEVLRHDENNVDLETEMTDLAENTLMHGVLSNLLRKQFLMLKGAISERTDA